MAGQSRGDEEFRQILHEIGGKERIHLVSDSCKVQDGTQVELLEEFVKDVFQCPFSGYRDDSADNLNHMASNLINGDLSAADGSQGNQTPFGNTATSNSVTTVRNRHSGQGGEVIQLRRSEDLELNTKLDVEDTEKATGLKGDIITRCISARGGDRVIDSPIIIFIFRQEFISCTKNRTCLKEILKDVKARMKTFGVLPALLGLVYFRGHCGEACNSIGVLDSLLRSVFTRHSSESIWVGPFVPKTADAVQTIKKNVCRTLQSSLRRGSTVSRRNHFSQMLPCFPWPDRGRRRNGAARTSVSRRQGRPECVPLKATSTANAQQTGCSKGK